ncbi:MAG: hypothetical protein JNJ45_08645 [Chthonomonas sp.]|nr:hypothetical protein [Chthonomonas sp.]
MKKLSHWTWIWIGLSISLAALAFGYFQHWKPNMTEKESFDAQKEKLEAIVASRGKAQKRVEDVSTEVMAKNDEWGDIVLRKTPQQGLQNGGIDLAVNPWQLVVDAPKFRDSIQAAVNRQVRTGGIKVITGPAIKPFSQEATNILASDFNYPALGYPVMFIDLGTITVRGTMQQIMANFESWANMPNYMAVSHGLRFNGTSPVLTGTYQVSMVAFIRADQVGAPVPEGAAPGASGGGGIGGPGAGPGLPAPGGGGGKLSRSTQNN